MMSASRNHARVMWDPQTTLTFSGRYALGGSPWGVVRLAKATVHFTGKLSRSASRGIEAHSKLDQATAKALVKRGLAHPLPYRRSENWDVTVVVPARDRLDALARCLESLKSVTVIVVDDCSTDEAAMAACVKEANATLLRRSANGGPSAARNDGLDASSSEFIAFVDSDCCVPDNWLDRLLPHFDDPSVGLVAPRILSRSCSGSTLERYEARSSALDLGAAPALVKPGSRIGYLPSAVLLVRRAALGSMKFDENMRIGEDVDLVWRTIQDGWDVRYDPRVEVLHESLTSIPLWIKRRYQYGTGAADLAKLHPQRLTPARFSILSIGAATSYLANRRAFCALLLLMMSVERAVTLRRQAAPVRLAPVLLVEGLRSEFNSLSRLLRTEWWPVGLSAAALAAVAFTTSRNRPARRLATCGILTVLGPLLADWLWNRRDMDPVRYIGLRMLEDAAYGSGVISGSVRRRTVEPMLPAIRMPHGSMAASSGLLSQVWRRLAGRS